MEFSFKTKINKVGINPYVAVPLTITRKMTATKGYIPVKGTINGFDFTQTLVPVKNSNYRLYVNGLMLKGTGLAVGDTANFIIWQDTVPRTADQIPMPAAFKKQLDTNKLLPAFKGLTDYRQKEILRYLNYLKTPEALQRNIDKVIASLKKKQDR